jgi:hypothetical protein
VQKIPKDMLVANSDRPGKIDYEKKKKKKKKRKSQKKRLKKRF